MPCSFCYYANMACKSFSVFYAIYHVAFLYRILDFTHNLKKSQISALAATFVLIISLSITAVFVLNKEPEHIAQDVFYSITISYENEQYGYFSNRLVIDKYGLNNISDLKQNPDLFTGILTETDIIQTDSVIDKDSIIGAKIYPYSDEVIILQGDGQFYYFEKIVTD